MRSLVMDLRLLCERNTLLGDEGILSLVGHLKTWTPPSVPPVRRN